MKLRLDIDCTILVFTSLNCSLTGDEAKILFTNLRNKYSRNKRKTEGKKVSGAGTDEVTQASREKVSRPILQRLHSGAHCACVCHFPCAYATSVNIRFAYAYACAYAYVAV